MLQPPPFSRASQLILGAVSRRRLYGSIPKGAPTHLVLGILRDPVQTRHAQLELARLGELAEAGPHRDEVWAGYGRGEVEDGEGEVVDPDSQLRLRMDVL